METSKWKLFMGVLLTVVVIILPAVAFGQKTLNIGLYVALTGFAAPAEIHCRDGALMAVERINGKGGITVKGEKYLLNIISEDNRTTAEGGKAAAEKLVYDHKVKFILGATVPYMNLAAAAVTEPAKVLRLVNYHCETPGELGVNLPYTFLANPGTYDNIVNSMEYMIEKYPKLKNFSTFIPADGAENYLLRIIEKEAKKRGLRQVTYVTWTHDTADFYPVVTKLLASRPEFIGVVNGFEAATGPKIKAAREQGFKGPICCFNADNPYDIVQIAGKNVVAPLFNHGYSKDLNDPQLTDDMKEVIRTAEAKLGKFNQFHLWPWNEVMILVQAIEKAQSLDPTEVANALRKMKAIKTVFGPGKMCGLKMYGINNKVCQPVAITEVLPGGVVKHIKWLSTSVE